MKFVYLDKHYRTLETLKNQIFFYEYRFFATCGPKTPWTEDNIKSYSLCPFYTDTGLLREDTKGDNSMIET